MNKKIFTLLCLGPLLLSMNEAEESTDEEEKKEKRKGRVQTAEEDCGKCHVTYEVENADFISQCEARWKEQGKKEKKQTKDKDDDDDPGTKKFRMSITWPN